MKALHDELDAIDPSSAAGQSTMQVDSSISFITNGLVIACMELGRSCGTAPPGRLFPESFELWTSATFVERKSNERYLLSAFSLIICSENNTVTLLHPVLGCNVYISSRRSVGRLLCGWGALHAVNSSKELLPSEHPESQDLKAVVEEFETVGSWIRFVELLTSWQSTLNERPH